MALVVRQVAEVVTAVLVVLVVCQEAVVILRVRTAAHMAAVAAAQVTVRLKVRVQSVQFV